MALSRNTIKWTLPSLGESHASTIDYVISATQVEWWEPLEARQIDASNGKLTADVAGEVEQEEDVLDPPYPRSDARGDP